MFKFSHLEVGLISKKALITVSKQKKTLTVEKTENCRDESRISANCTFSYYSYSADLNYPEKVNKIELSNAFFSNWVRIRH